MVARVKGATTAAETVAVVAAVETVEDAADEFNQECAPVNVLLVESGSWR